jgi:hypothetical protein
MSSTDSPAVLDLLAEEIEQPTWDELTSAMLDGEPEDRPDTFSCSSACSSCGGGSCGGGFCAPS